MNEEHFYPKVTIVIPVYNGESYVSYAIDSALAQSYSNLEILVINDGSSDKTEEIVKSYGNCVRYIKKENGGVSSALNLAIKEMSGEWLSWLSHDDVYYPDKIENQIKFIENESKKLGVEYTKIIACCANDRIDAKGNHIIRPIKYGKNYTDNIKQIIDQVGNYSIGGCCVLASRKVYQVLGGFNENNRTCSDAEMWYNMILHGYYFLFQKEVLVHSRQHNGMVSVTKNELCISEGTDLHAWVAKQIISRRSDSTTTRELILALNKRGYMSVGKKYIHKLVYFDKVIVKVTTGYLFLRKACRSGLRFIYRKLFY